MNDPPEPELPSSTDAPTQGPGSAPKSKLLKTLALLSLWIVMPFTAFLKLSEQLDDKDDPSAR